MKRRFRSVRSRAGWLGLGSLGIVMALAACAGNGLSGAAGGNVPGDDAANRVQISTPPEAAQQVVFIDQNQNGINDEGETVGAYDVFNGLQPITFSWDTYPFPEGVSGSYRISVWANIAPLDDPPTWMEMFVWHHWADNPNGTSFTMGVMDYPAQFCTSCPVQIVVQAETYTLTTAEPPADPYQYAFVQEPVAGLAVQASKEFVINLPQVGEAADTADQGSDNQDEGGDPPPSGPELCDSTGLVPPVPGAIYVRTPDGTCVWVSTNPPEPDPDEIDINRN